MTLGASLPGGLALQVSDPLPLNGVCNAVYNPGPNFTDLQYVWTFTPAGGSASSISRTITSCAVRGSDGCPSPDLGAHLGAGVPINLVAGPYTISVHATDGVRNSNTASQTVTLVNADFSGFRVYPNPWRSDKHIGRSVTFDRMPAGSTVKLFTVSGHLVKTLTTDVDTALWDLSNDSGDKVGSGIYIYLIKDAQGDKEKGKLAVIK